MAEFQDKLLRYRRQKERALKFQQFKEKIKSYIMPSFVIKVHEDEDPAVNDSKIEQTKLQHASELEPIALATDSDESATLSETELNESANISATADKLQYLLRLVYLLFWLTCYVIAIELQFGIVYLMFSALIGIYLNTRTEKKHRNEISAYSVFNKNCESIDGTLKAEQFEKEMGFRQK